MATPGKEDKEKEGEEKLITVNLREAKNIIKTSMRTKTPCLLLGTPGIGKSEIVEQVAKKEGGGFLCFEASSLDPTDIRGVLVPAENNKSCFTKSPLLPDVERHGKEGILLIDELPSGLPSVQVALHPLFHPRERRLGGDKLPDGWIPMATGNYVSDNAGARNILSALSDRICILNIVEDYAIWKNDYAIPNKIHPMVIAFLHFRPNLLSTFSKRNKNSKEKTFATPRSHAAVSAVLYEADKNKLSQEELLAMLTGLVGAGIATEYIAYMKLCDKLTDPREILVKGNYVKHKDPSVLYALCTAIASHLDKVEIPINKAIDRMLEYSLQIEAEFGGLLIRDAYILHYAKMKQATLWPTVANRYMTT